VQHHPGGGGSTGVPDQGAGELCRGVRFVVWGVEDREGVLAVDSGSQGPRGKGHRKGFVFTVSGGAFVWIERRKQASGKVACSQSVSGESVSRAACQS